MKIKIEADAKAYFPFLVAGPSDGRRTLGYVKTAEVPIETWEWIRDTMNEFEKVQDFLYNLGA